jgi:hypothetical protein
MCFVNQLLEPNGVICHFHVLYSLFLLSLEKMYYVLLHSCNQFGLYHVIFTDLASMYVLL